MNLSFIQFTDMHVGSSVSFPGIVRQAGENLTSAINEINDSSFKPDFILATGDCTNAGGNDLLIYKQLIGRLNLPVYSIPSSHDLALRSLPGGGMILNDNPEQWEKNIGPARFAFVHNGVKLILFEPFKKMSETRGENDFDESAQAWLEAELAGDEKTPKFIGYHIPVLPAKGGYIGWRNADKFLNLIGKYNIIALISGHRHRNAEDKIGNNITQIQTGPLAGFQWTGLPPHYWFPVRAGYRMFRLEGNKIFSFYKEVGVKNQVNLEHIGRAHTQGPRPQVRPAVIHGDLTISTQAYSEESRIKKVEYSLKNDKWQPMVKYFDDVWSEWQADLALKKLNNGFDVIVVRSVNGNDEYAYDSVPVLIRKDPSDPESVVSGPETVFELITQPLEAEYLNDRLMGLFPWRSIPQ
ncbi:MAG: metallophosphoesterase [Kiritimatiellaeota bacterium]|nr:metallophosphoesterase [Kiritimatiellota bacterium]